jgi:hypothetical protein
MYVLKLSHAFTIQSYLPIFLAAENIMIAVVAAQPNQTEYTPTNMYYIMLEALLTIFWPFLSQFKPYQPSSIHQYYCCNLHV